MKISPVILQETIYNGGLYNEPVIISGNNGGNSDAFAIVQTTQGLTNSTGYNIYFLNAYSIMKNLSSITEIKDSKDNTFLMMVNDITHCPCLLQEPDYVPAANIDNTLYDVDMTERYTLNGITMDMSTIEQRTHYHINVATYRELANWFDYLRVNGVYDNTRIILVADHGKDIGQFDINCNGRDMESFMPLLMVKDFNAKGFNVNEEFMTNADTATIATKGLINNPVNPFTGNPINSNAKSGFKTTIFTEAVNRYENYGTKFPMAFWYVFDGVDPHISENWKYAGNK